MNRQPEVSIVMPAHNRRELLKRALRSVLGQTYGEWEAIVVDDGSTDGTGSAVGEFADERLRVLRHPVRRGPAAARNTAIAASKGRFIAFLDSDDEWLPAKLEKQVEALRKAPSDVGVVYTGTLRHFKGKTYVIPSASANRKEGDVFAAILRGSYLVPTPAAAVKKECLDAVGFFDESLPALEEWDLWIRLAKACRFRYLPDLLTVSHYTPGSVSADRLLFLRAKRLVLRKHRTEFLRSPRALGSVLGGMARLWAGHVLGGIKEAGRRPPEGPTR
ncbi:MAG: glycosyltransferase family 2 protein [Candidatus Aminicenantales bacterium]|jgi:glycosyltransferase involved in cell wall biosynthesis